MTTHSTTDSWMPVVSSVGGTVGPPQKTEFLRTAYGKHAAELVAIDDQQQKLLLVMLGIFGAGATYLASLGKGDAGRPPHEVSIVLQLGLTLITITLVGL